MTGIKVSAHRFLAEVFLHREEPAVSHSGCSDSGNSAKYAHY